MNGSHKISLRLFFARFFAMGSKILFLKVRPKEIRMFFKSGSISF